MTTLSTSSRNICQKLRRGSLLAGTSSRIAKWATTTCFQKLKQAKKGNGGANHSTIFILQIYVSIIN